MNYYDAIADGYSELHEQEQREKYELIQQQLKVKAHHEILDVGCGPGWGSEYFECNFTGIDPSKKLIQQGIKNGVRLHHGNAENLPFPDSFFDSVISVTAIQNFDDMNTAVKEISRVAKKDIVITCLKHSQKIFDVEMLLREEFKVMDVLENKHDLIFLCHKREKLK